MQGRSGERQEMESPMENEHNEESFGYAIQLTLSSALPMALHSAIQLGIFDILGNSGPNATLSSAEIASRMSAKNPDAPAMLDRILRLLASHQVVDCSLDDSVRLYSLNNVSKHFVINQSGFSLGPLIALVQDKVILDSWNGVKDAIMEGGSPFNRIHKTPIFRYCGMDESFNRTYNKGMFHRTSIVMEEILRTYKGFESVNLLVDVGGGLGQTLQAIISKYPSIRGINFDLPHVIQNAPAYSGIEHIGGDMFQSVPKGDAIFMKSILHDWGDDDCLKLLKNCYNSVPDDGKVIVVDAVLPVLPNTSSITQANFQTDVICMTVYEGGKDRTKAELLALATKAGFRGITCVTFAFNYCVMEFIK